MSFSLASRLAGMGALLAWLAACSASGPHTLAPDYAAKAPRRVAVLLFSNETTSLDAPVALRELVVKHLPRWGYEVLDPKKVVETLRDKGITDGGQLPTITPKELGQALGADGLFYGHVMAFQNTITGVYNRRAVEVRFRLVHSRSGEQLWAAQEKEVKQETNISKEDEELLQKIAMGLVKGLLAASLKEESKLVVLEALYRLPKPDGKMVKRFTPTREARGARDVAQIVGSVLGGPTPEGGGMFPFGIGVSPGEPEEKKAPPAQAKKKGVPPGLAKKGGIPPGLAKKGGVPPGLAKKEGVPPGLAKKGIPPGLAKKGGVPPGLAKKGGVPPGLAKKGVPPGLAKKMGPPPLVVPGAPRYVAVPGTKVSVMLGVKADVFRVGGMHFYFHNGVWYRATNHQGPWKAIAADDLPPGLRGKSPKELKAKVKGRKAKDDESKEEGTKKGFHFLRGILGGQ